MAPSEDIEDQLRDPTTPTPTPAPEWRQPLPSRRVRSTGPEPWYAIARRTALMPMRLWLNWRFEGWEYVEQDGPLLVACNHIGYIDSLTIANMLWYVNRRPRFLGKAEMFEQPGLGWALRRVRTIPVARGTGSTAPLEAARTALQRDETVVIYPEGTVTKREDGLPQRAKAGLGWLAITSNVPVTPIAGWGTQPIWQKSGPGSLRPGRPIWLKAGPPIDFSRYQGQEEDPRALRAVVDEMMERLTEMTAELKADYPERWTT